MCVCILYFGFTIYMYIYFLNTLSKVQCVLGACLGRRFRVLPAVVHTVVVLFACYTYEASF